MEQNVKRPVEIADAAKACGMPYASERWLGGILTNFRTIRSRLDRLFELEALIESGEIKGYSKKAQSRLNREYRKIYRNLSGVRDMNRLPEAIIVVDPQKEHNCVHEAHVLGIKVVGLIDTDSDPDLVDLPIPGNDDGMRSIKLILSHLVEAVLEGKPQTGNKDDSAPAETEEEEYKPIPSI